MKTATDAAREPAQARLDPPHRDVFVARYQKTLLTGLAANPPPVRSPRQRARLKPSPARNLLERRLVGEDQILALPGPSSTI